MGVARNLFFGCSYMRKFLTLSALCISLFVNNTFGENLVISKNLTGLPGTGFYPKFSQATGRFVVFVSSANDIVPNDGNGSSDIFVYDRDYDGNGIFDEAGSNASKIVRVSLTKNLGETNANSTFPSISSTGRFITFSSIAWNIVNNDSNGVSDVFLVDRDPDNNGNFYDKAQTIKRVSQRKKNDGTTIPSNGASTYSSVSTDGKRVAFQSQATNLLGGLVDTDDFDVFLWRDEGSKPSVEVVSFDDSNGSKTTADGTSQTPEISADGSRIVYQSNSANITSLTSGQGGGLAPDHFYVYDTAIGSNMMVDVTPSGTLSLSATNDTDTYMIPHISGDGSYVVFASKSTDLVANDSDDGYRDIFLRDFFQSSTGVTRKISAAIDGDPADGASSGPRISNDGRYIIFETYAKNLATGIGGEKSVILFDRDRDGNGVFDETSFSGSSVHQKVIYRSDPNKNDSNPGDATISGDVVSLPGGLANITYHSSANNLTTNDTNNTGDVFVTSSRLHAKIGNGCSTPGPLNQSGPNGLRVWIDNASPLKISDGFYLRGETPGFAAGQPIFLKIGTVLNNSTPIGATGCAQYFDEFGSSKPIFLFNTNATKKFSVGPIFLPAGQSPNGLKFGIQLIIPNGGSGLGHWSAAFHTEFEP